MIFMPFMVKLCSFPAFRRGAALPLYPSHMDFPVSEVRRSCPRARRGDES